MVRHAKKVHVTHTSLYFVAFVSLSMVLLLSLFTKYSNTFSKTDIKKTTLGSIFNASAFSSVSIEGKAFVVYDIVDRRIIASHNATTSLPLASITKVMTALTATTYKSKSAPITVTKKSIEDSYDLGLKEGQVWQLKELLKYTLIISSNDGAEIVADSFGGKAIFLQLMNDEAKSLGIEASFTDPAGRDSGGVIGGKGSAYDVAKLLSIARLRFPEILDATIKKRQKVFTKDGALSGIPNTNQNIEAFPGAEGSKTGYTDLAGGNLGVIVDVTLGHPVAIVVLGSTKEGRFRDMELLYKTLKRSIRTYP